MILLYENALLALQNDKKPKIFSLAAGYFLTASRFAIFVFVCSCFSTHCANFREEEKYLSAYDVRYWNNIN